MAGPISILAFTEATAQVTVSTSEGPVRVEYRPWAVTLQSLNDFADMGRRADAGQERTDWATAEAFCKMVTMIEVTGPVTADDGSEVPEEELIPVEPRYVVKLPFRFINRIMERIGAQLQAEDEEYSKSSISAAKLSRDGLPRGSFSP